MEGKFDVVECVTAISKKYRLSLEANIQRFNDIALAFDESVKENEKLFPLAVAVNTAKHYFAEAILNSTSNDEGRKDFFNAITLAIYRHYNIWATWPLQSAPL